MKSKSLAPLVVAALALSACQAESSVISTYNPDPLVTIAAADYAESEILSQIYAQALQNEGYRARVEYAGGDSASALDAVEESEATFAVGFTGSVLRQNNPGADVTAPEDVYEEMVASLPDGLTAGDTSSATDQPVYFVSRNTAETMGLSDMSDLSPHCAGLSLGARQEVLDDTELSASVGETYECAFARRQALPSDPRLVVEAIRAGTVSVGVLQSADPALEGDDLVVLADDQEAVPAQEVVPIFRKGSLSEDQLAVVNGISGEITTDDIRELLRGTEFGTSSAVRLATYWLERAGN